MTKAPKELTPAVARAAADFIDSLVIASGASAGMLKMRGYGEIFADGPDLDVTSVYTSVQARLLAAERSPSGTRTERVTVAGAVLHVLAASCARGAVVLSRGDGPWTPREVALVELVIHSDTELTLSPPSSRRLSTADGASSWPQRANGANGALSANGEAEALSVDELRQAIADAVVDEQMHLEFQPELSLATGELLGLEALLRWDAPGVRNQGRDEVIALAEESGLMPVLGDWIFDAACDQLARWVAELPTFAWPVRVNVSALQLNDQFVDRIEKRLRQGDIRAELLCIELTEHVALAEPRAAVTTDGDGAADRDVLRRIRALGVKLALDDVGTGHNSLSRIKDTPLDILKIDRSFITELDSHPFDHAIVDAIVLLGRELGLEVVAEGVETPAVARALLKAGCWRAQGHLLRKAARAEELHSLVTSGRLVDTALPFGAW
ncbi:EAL domain, c-di-GMP-specific phosphodiesterase class I (or its enzymatically inactive variant) [Frankineae bacterium MT45]|nr:EAL domain, c-di-GMP-specific phosphodiesterase class I (or its enzymatically inactive variant) [Frankineae bacterium MT45]